MTGRELAKRVIAALELGFASAAEPSAGLVGAAVDFFTHYLEGRHHQKEEKHLFPLLEKRGIPRQGGPLAVMLSEHDKNRALLQEFEALGHTYAAKDKSVRPMLRAVFEAYATLMKQHFWKENDILFPMGLRVLSAADGDALISGFIACENEIGSDSRNRYHSLSHELAKLGQVEDLSVGLDRAVLAAMLNTLPVELPFVDAEDTVRYFSHENGDKKFSRSRSAIGMKVQDCHPRHSVHMVNQIKRRHWRNA